MNKTSIKILHGFDNDSCTNGGISANKKYLTISWGVKSLEDADTDLVLCDGTNGRTEPIQSEAHLREVAGRMNGYLKAVPAGGAKKGLIGPMSGGNYAMDSNGMSILQFPVPIHDRYETQEQYDFLSR